MDERIRRLLGYPWRTDNFLLILKAAIDGTTIVYSDLPGGRFHGGKYLARIAAEEARQGRPPLTSVVVEKRTGRPAGGFIEAMKDIGFVPRETTEDDESVWRRAIAETHAYWRRSSGS
jgi:hypothetical protein